MDLVKCNEQWRKKVAEFETYAEARAYVIDKTDHDADYRIRKMHHGYAVQKVVGKKGVEVAVPEPVRKMTKREIDLANAAYNVDDIYGVPNDGEV